MIEIDNMDEVFVDSNGEIAQVTGTYDSTNEELDEVFAAVVPVTFDTPPHPIHESMRSNGYEYAIGELGSATGTWVVDNVPGATGDCSDEKLVAWGTYKSAPNTFLSDTEIFKGYSSGSGCSGSGSGGGGGGALIMGSIIHDAAPVLYRADFDFSAMQIDDSVGSFLRSGLLPNLMLEYDAIASSARAAIWRTQQSAHAGLEMALRVKKDTATLTAQSAVSGKSAKPIRSRLIWRGRNWNFFGLNRLVADPSMSLPGVSVEPVV